MLNIRLPLTFLMFTAIAISGCDDSDSDGNSDGGTLPACSDRIDNDGDGLIDADDPGCRGPSDTDEEDVSILSQCADGVDNDGDGRIDLEDPGCEDEQDPDESDDPNTTQCDDGIDNDDDGAIDLDDRGCSSRGDNNEGDDPELPECADGVDNDGDGFVDFPDDPGCGSEFDGREAEGGSTNLPQCANGLDDDDDGRIDLADPGCSSVADPRELDGEGDLPACSNLLDDDADGQIDFPNDRGCSAAGDQDEADPATVPACDNSADDDGDGLVDYPEDPGCAGAGDRDEIDPPVAPRCADGFDNDQDGSIDYPDDRGCQSAADSSEGGSCGRNITPAETSPGVVIRGDSTRAAFAMEGSCGGRGAPEIVFVHTVTRPIEALVVRTDIEGNELETTIYVRRGCLDPATEIACNREPVGDGVAANSIRIPAPTIGEYYIIVDGAGGRGGNFAVLVEEVLPAQCLNGEDDDADGRIDYPEDPGCVRADDRDETDPPTPPACSDNVDNDRDGVVDYPIDFGCQSAADNDETDVCGQGVRILNYPVGAPSMLTDTSGGVNLHTGTCEASGGPEKIFLYENPFNAELTISVNYPDTIPRTTVYARAGCGDVANLGCSTGEGNEMKGSFTLERVPPGPVFIFVDHPFGLGGSVRLSVAAERLPPGCSDGIDNDEDGFLDGDDLGCEDELDEDERDPPLGDALPACFDRRDNDDDGLIDYPFDPGCSSKGALSEDDPVEPPACANGEDDDEDGVIDFPADSGCFAAGDADEERPRRIQCDNRIDDDQDGYVDYPIDPGCAAVGDLSETDEAITPECFDQVDNDRDGIADYPFDPGCVSAGDIDETDSEAPAACFNQLDDDGDGLIDFPFDPGCAATSDASEDDPGFPPACRNQRDDDADGQIDWPNDRGCRFAGDTREEDPFVIPARCADGVDNDGDAIVDLNDPGCENGDDDDESDPVELPLCGNEIDDDEDGLADWPLDPGCQAFGDLAESQECAMGFEAVELPRNGTVMGMTAENAPDRKRNRCGGLEAPEVVYRYVVEPDVERVTFSADNAGTNYPVIISVLRDCEEPRSFLACAGDFRAPRPTVTLENPDSGEYYVVIDGGGPERWVGSANPVQLPNDPRNFQARNDIRANGWTDGGNDAFDGFGRTTVTFGNGSMMLDVSLGERPVAVGGYNINFKSELFGNVWRMTFEPAVENDEREVGISITGNLGSDGSTRGAQHILNFQGRDVRSFHSNDGRNSDPPLTYLLLPSDPEHLDRVDYGLNRDNMTASAQNITLPATFWVALSYADRAAVSQSLLNNIEIRGNGADGAPRFGNFELSAQEE